MNRWVDMTDGSSVLYIGADNCISRAAHKKPSGQWYFETQAPSLLGQLGVFLKSPLASASIKQVVIDVYTFRILMGPG
jgi:hypothetical protein